MLRHVRPIFVSEQFSTVEGDFLQTVSFWTDLVPRTAYGIDARAFEKKDQIKLA